MALAIRIDPTSDHRKAHALIPFAVNRVLAQFKTDMRHGNLNALDRDLWLQDGSFIRCQAILYGIEPLFIVTIFAPPEGAGKKKPEEEEIFLLYLVTVAKPYPIEGICLIDEQGKPLYQPYIYKIIKNGAAISPTKGPKIITNVGRTLTCQQDVENLYCDLSFFNLHSHDIGGIVPGLTDNCDYSTYWGYPKETSTYCTYPIMPYWGSDRAELIKDGKLVAPAEGNGIYISGRHNFSVDENGKRDGYNLRYDRVSTEYSTGCLWLPDRIDAQGLYRLLAGHAITYFDNNGQYVLGRDNIILKDIYTNKHNWIYYVPIMTIAKDQFLYRSHEKVGSGAQYGSPSGYYGSFQDWSCYEADLTENLVVGNEVIDTFRGTVSQDIENMSLTGADTVTRPGTSQYILNGCPDAKWSVSGTDVTINQAGIVTMGNSACGSFIVTATCKSCPGTFSKTVRITNSGGWSPLHDACVTYHFYYSHSFMLERTCSIQILEGIRHLVGYQRMNYSSDPCHCGNFTWMGNPSNPGTVCEGAPMSLYGDCIPYFPCSDPCFASYLKYTGIACQWVCGSGGGCTLGYCS